MKDLLMQIKRYSTKILVLLIICMISLSSFITFIQLKNGSPFSDFTDTGIFANSSYPENEYETEENIYNENKISFSYIPIDNFNGTGDDFTVDDNLQVNHEVNLELDSANGRSDSYTISAISDYSTDSLQYNMQITSKSDIKKLENVNLKIAQYIVKREQVLLSELITKFQDEGLEEVLTTYFKMVNKGFLKRRQFMSFSKE